MHNVPLMAGGWRWDCPVENSSCLRCHLNMTAAPPVPPGASAVLITIDDFFVFPSAWHSVTFGWFRRTKTKGARLQMRYRFFFFFASAQGAPLLYSLPVGVVFFAFSFGGTNTDHRRWPSQGLQSERINPDTLTSRLADGDESKRVAVVRYVGFLRLLLRPHQGPFKLADS